MHDYIRNGLDTLAAQVGGPLRQQAHAKHHDAIDSYVRFLDVLTRYVNHLEKQMSKISEALDKRTNERDQWKNYANSLQPQVDAANAAAQAAQAAQKEAEDKLAAIPIIPDAQDAATVDAVLNAPDDLPPVPPAQQ